jgi:hypothetical protein
MECARIGKSGFFFKKALLPTHFGVYCRRISEVIFYWAEPWARSITGWNPKPEGIDVTQTRVPVSIIYTCSLLATGLILSLLAYEGMFDGLGTELLDDLREILKFLLG